MLNVRQIASLEEIRPMKDRYIRALPYAQEFYMEIVQQQCSYFVIEYASRPEGYFCVTPQKVLFEFYLEGEALKNSQVIFRLLLDQGWFMAAECKTFDPLFMSLCIDFHKKAASSAYLFRDYEEPAVKPAYPESLGFRKADLKEKAAILSISGDFFDDLDGQLKKGEIFVVYDSTELVAAGLAQEVYPGTLHRDIGMIVAQAQRNKGIGTYIITKLREYCLERGYIPICGCWYYNYASRRTLEKAGYITRHRIVRFDF